jgi:hypothetical protein
MGIAPPSVAGFSWGEGPPLTNTMSLMPGDRGFSAAAANAGLVQPTYGAPPPPLNPNANPQQHHVLYNQPLSVAAAKEGLGVPAGVTISEDGNSFIFSALYLDCRAMELAGYIVTRMMHMRRGMLTKAQKREVWALADELADIADLPIAREGLSLCKRATIYGINAITSRQAGLQVCRLTPAIGY